MFNAAHRVIGSFLPTSLTTSPRAVTLSHFLKGCAHLIDMTTTAALTVISAVAYDKTQSFIPRRYLQEIPQVLVEISTKTTAVTWAGATLAAFGLHLYFALQREKAPEQIINLEATEQDNNSPNPGGDPHLTTKEEEAKQQETQGSNQTNNTGLQTPKRDNYSFIRGPQTNRKQQSTLRSTSGRMRARSAGSFFQSEDGSMPSPILPFTERLKALDSPAATQESPGANPLNPSFKGHLVKQASQGPTRTFFKQDPYARTAGSHQERVKVMSDDVTADQLNAVKMNLKNVTVEEKRPALPATSTNPLERLKRHLSMPNMTPVLMNQSNGVDPREWGSPLKPTQTSGQSENADQ